MTVYTLFGQTGGGSASGDNASYTLGVQFTVSSVVTLTGIWWYSAATQNVLPAACCIFAETSPGSGSIVSGTQNNSPSWSGAAGSGWVRCSYSAPALSPGNTYKACVLGSGGGTPGWYSATSHYWDTGSGSGGLASGPLSAPGNAGGDGGQDTFVTPAAALTYPASSFNAANYWVDVEVTASGVTPAGPAYTALMSGMLCLPSTLPTVTITRRR